uniref:Uncharacterized protein n=3 Tax=Anguilla anguilla TaxID=7936 RepID=A0A0E9S6Q5_ANGAN
MVSLNFHPDFNPMWCCIHGIWYREQHTCDVFPLRSTGDFSISFGVVNRHTGTPCITHKFS